MAAKERMKSDSAKQNTRAQQTMIKQRGSVVIRSRRRRWLRRHIVRAKKKYTFLLVMVQKERTKRDRAGQG